MVINRTSPGSGRLAFAGRQLALSFVLAVAAATASLADVIAVNTTALTVDGSTGSIASLIADPGPDGVISLREAIAAANNTATGGANPGNTIRFALPAGSVITLYSTLFITQPFTTIEGASAGSTPAVSVVPDSPFLWLVVNTHDCQVRRLSTALMAVGGANAFNNTIADCWLGLGTDGKPFALRGMHGLQIELGAHDNTVERCVVGGNTTGNTSWGTVGIYLLDGAHDNVIRNCSIGVDAAGALVPNDFGVGVSDSHNNQVGLPRTISDGGNIISGSNMSGVAIFGTGSTGNSVSDNIIGLAADGATPAPNQVAGVYLDAGAHGNIIGGERWAGSGPRNVIGGNAGSGISISDPGTDANVVKGNYIGVQADGVSPAPNALSGVIVQDGAAANIIGGEPVPAAEVRNIIGGNSQAGVYMPRAGRVNLIQGNIIGRDEGSLKGAPNTGGGVVLFDTGGTVIGAGPNAVFPEDLGNVIAANGGPGIVMLNAVGGSVQRGTTVRGNSIHDNATSGLSLGPNVAQTGDYIVLPALQPVLNDWDDSDDGPNGRMNTPVGVEAWFDAPNNQTVIRGVLNGPPNEKAVVDVYAARTADPAESVLQGERYLASASVTIPAGQNTGTWEATYAGRLPDGLPSVVATATNTTVVSGNPEGSTSEFSTVFVPWGSRVKVRRGVEQADGTTVQQVVDDYLVCYADSRFYFGRDVLVQPDGSIALGTGVPRTGVARVDVVTYGGGYRTDPWRYSKYGFNRYIAVWKAEILPATVPKKYQAYARTCHLQFDSAAMNPVYDGSLHTVINSIAVRDDMNPLPAALSGLYGLPRVVGSQDDAEIENLLTSVARATEVARLGPGMSKEPIPPQILHCIAWHESYNPYAVPARGWNQFGIVGDRQPWAADQHVFTFDANSGQPLRSTVTGDGGIGIMQLTAGSALFDTMAIPWGSPIPTASALKHLYRLATDAAYNIEAGAYLLGHSKWGLPFNPYHDEKSSAFVEFWREPVWRYNGRVDYGDLKIWSTVSGKQADNKAIGDGTGHGPPPSIFSTLPPIVVTRPVVEHPPLHGDYDFDGMLDVVVESVTTTRKPGGIIGIKVVATCRDPQPLAAQGEIRSKRVIPGPPIVNITDSYPLALLNAPDANGAFNWDITPSPAIAQGASIEVVLNITWNGIIRRAVFRHKV